jgi:riboflavin biosynthesis pyrimidine reductase
LADVIVVGAGTARDEGYAGFEVDRAVRERHGLSPFPAMAVVSRGLDIPTALVQPGQVIVTTADADPERLAALRETMEVVAVGDGAIDWTAVLGTFAERGWNRVLCEGGPSLHGELVRLDLVDELCLTVAPLLAGGPAGRIATGPLTPPRRMSLRHALTRDHRMTLGHAIEADGGLLTRWVRDRGPVRP